MCAPAPEAHRHLRCVCQDLEFARYAVQADLLPTLFHAALAPVALPGFPAVDRVVAQWHSAVARLVEASHGTHYCHEVKGGQHAVAAQREAARAKIAQAPVIGVSALRNPVCWWAGVSMVSHGRAAVALRSTGTARRG